MRRLIFFAIIIIFMPVKLMYAQVTFTNMAESAGLRDLPTAWVTWGDYDNDGYADMIASSNIGRRLYHNEGNGTFRDVTEIAGASGGAGMNAAYFIDFDNDGNLDLFMPANSFSGETNGDRLLQNKGNGIFADVSQKAGLYPNGRRTKYWNKEATSFDYDNDGLLDIFISNGDTIPPFPNIFYHNEGNGRFKDIAAQIGLDDSKITGVYPCDYDNDGNMDLYMSVCGSDYFPTEPNDQGIDQLWHNEGNNVFVDVAKEAGLQKNLNLFMGFFFDYDNDGDLDLLQRTLKPGDDYGYDILFRNNGDGTFSDVTKLAGILPIGKYASGTDYGDYDNDGWLDMIFTWQPVGEVGPLPVILYHNNRNGTFTNVKEYIGISSYSNTDSGPDFVDYDNDGDLDIFLAIANALYRNNGTGNHWLQLKLVGSESNHDAIGARVKVISGKLSMIREIFSGSHTNHSDRLPLHFGLEKNSKADFIEIRWPSGIVQTFADIPADQRITIDESEGIIPVVHRVIPNSGHPDGGTILRIYGEGFLPGSKVLLNGAEAKDVHVETSNLITAVTPPGVRGLVDMEIISPDGKHAILEKDFRYTSMQVAKISPESGPTKGGIQIQIEGAGFQQGAQVFIGDNSLVNPLVTPIFIQGILPSGISGMADLSIINPDGETFFVNDMFSYISPPTIEGVNAKFMALSTTNNIKIFGSGFIRTPLVLIDGFYAISVTFSSSNSLEITPPPIPFTGPQDIVVTNPDGQSAVLNDGITIVAPPKIKSIKPFTGSLDGGTKITIIGEPSVEYINQVYNTNLRLIDKVLIGELECTDVTVESDYVVTAITPPNTPGPKDITIIDEVGQDDTIKNAFTYSTAPQITKVIPNNGKLAGGTNITIEGSGFQPGAKVVMETKDGYAVLAPSVQFISSTIITAVTPTMNHGLCDITVRNPDKQSITFPDGFTYNPIPTISRITPYYGSSSGGTKIVVEGTGFLPGVRLMIGEKPATAQLKDDMIIEAITPSNQQGVWDVRIVNPDTQEVVKPGGFITVGELAYNYPNPFRAFQGTTFRYVTNEPVDSITVKIFNLAGVPIDIVRQDGSNDVRWQDSDTNAGMYLYVMEVNLGNGEKKQFKKTLEVYK